MQLRTWCIAVPAALLAVLGSGCDDELPPIDDGGVQDGARPDAAPPDSRPPDEGQPPDTGADAGADLKAGDARPPCTSCGYQETCRDGLLCVPAVCLDPALVLELQFEKSLADTVDGALPLTSAAAPKYDAADGNPAPALLRAPSDVGLTYVTKKLTSKSWTVSLWLNTSLAKAVLNKDRYLLRVRYDSGQVVELLHHSFADKDPAPWFGARIAPPAASSSCLDLMPQDRLPVNTWTHVVLTMEEAPPAAQSPLRVWIDGDGKGGLLSIGPLPSGTVTAIVVGGHDSPTANDEALPGKIDEVRVFNRLLTRAEIKQLAFDPCH